MTSAQKRPEQLITEHLDLWTSAIKQKSSAGRGSSSKTELYGIKKLRELILELAVRGLLVPQDPNDEPASELIKRISSKKLQLANEGKIKKQKPSTPIQDNSIPFSIPNSWKWTRLQDISEYIQRGKGPSYSDSGKVRVISQKCIQWMGFDLEPARFIEDKSLDKYQAERFLISGDLLWNSTGTGTVGRIAILPESNNGSLVADSHVTVIRTLEVNQKYIWCYIASPGVQSRIEPEHENSLVSGSTKQVELNTSSVTQVELPLPPLAEQHRIVAKVDELMALCDQLEQQTEASLSAHQSLVETLLGALTATDGGNAGNAGVIASAPTEHERFQQAWQRIAQHFDTLFTTEHSIDQLKQTILQLAVMGKLVPQDPNDEPASELLKRIVVEKAKLVKERKIKKQKATTSPDDRVHSNPLPEGWESCCFGSIISLISGQHLKPDEYFESELPNSIPYLTGPAEFGENHPLPTRFTNETRAVSQAGDILITCKGSGVGKTNVANQDIFISRQLMAIRPIIIDSRFALLVANSINQYLRENIVGIAIPGISREDILDAPINLPPIGEQDRIVKKIDSLMAICDQLKAHLNQAKTTQLNLADALTEQAIA